MDISFRENWITSPALCSVPALLSTTGMLQFLLHPQIKQKKQQDRQCMYTRTLRPICATIVAVEKQWVLHNLSVCICSLSIQQAMHMHHFGIRGLPHSTLFFHIISYMAHKTCFDFIYNYCLKHFSFKK